ncbi:MAG: hypothetical protein Q7K44_00140 [Candidatus Liptonbacteria bacterium]|nr:hypothetical protein [Candidatus Liptonbacteria bacterium]
MKTLYILLVLILLAVGGYFYYDSTKVENITMGLADGPAAKLLVSVIKDRGIDTKNHLNISAIYSDPGETLRKLEERVDGIVAGTYPVLSLPKANKDGKKLRVFVPYLFSDLDLVVKADSPYQTLEDMKGQSIGIRPKSSAGYQALAIAVNLTGLSLEKDFKLAFGSIGENIQFLTGGQVAATILAPLGSGDLLAGGKYRLLSNLRERWEKETGALMPFSSITAYQDWIEANPQTMKRLRATILEAQNYIVSNPDIINQYKDLLEIKTEKGLENIKSRLVNTYAVKWDPETHRLLLKKAAELGFVEPAQFDEFFID